MFKRKGITTRGLLPKDLLNDLEREVNVRERIKQFLDKPLDPPPMFPNAGRLDANHIMTSSMQLFTTAMSFRLDQSEMFGSSRRPDDVIEITNIGDTQRRFIRRW